MTHEPSASRPRNLAKRLLASLCSAKVPPTKADCEKSNQQKMWNTWVLGHQQGAVKSQCISPATSHESAVFSTWQTTVASTT